MMEEVQPLLPCQQLGGDKLVLSKPVGKRILGSVL